MFRLTLAMTVILTATGCGRVDLEPPTGSQGGACYGNGTCDSGLVCSSALVCVSLDLCTKVTCSNHGTCILDANGPRCECEAGYQARELTCEPCGSACISGCPVGMILNSAHNVCIDAYEATINLSADCTGPRYGRLIDDYPPEYPDLVESSDCTGNCGGVAVEAPSVDLYACSIGGVIPSRWMTWYQAKRACENAGKRLCTPLEWTSSCSGPDGYAYPYGDNRLSNTCNTWETSGEEPTNTGSKTACEGGYPGVFDMSGNLREWTVCDTSCTRGGSMLDYASTASCLDASTAARTTADDVIGIRCCKAP